LTALAVALRERESTPKEPKLSFSGSDERIKEFRLLEDLGPGLGVLLLDFGPGFGAVLLDLGPALLDLGPGLVLSRALLERGPGFVFDGNSSSDS
jgi:hypothetical protein